MATGTESAQGIRRRSRSVLWIAASTITAVVFLGTWAWRATNVNAPPAAASVFTFEAPAGTTFTLTHAVSPDGRRIAFTMVRIGSAQLLQIFYSIRSERPLMEQLDYNLLFRWFVGMDLDEPISAVTVFTKNRDRLLNQEMP